MINPNGKRCQLRMSYSKCKEDVIISYPEGEGTDQHAILLCALFDDTTLRTLQELGYDTKSIKFSINIDWKSAVAKKTFNKLHQAIEESMPKSLDQLSFHDYIVNKTMVMGDARK